MLKHPPTRIIQARCVVRLRFVHTEAQMREMIRSGAACQVPWLLVHVLDHPENSPCRSSCPGEGLSLIFCCSLVL